MCARSCLLLRPASRCVLCEAGPAVESARRDRPHRSWRPLSGAARPGAGALSLSQGRDSSGRHRPRRRRVRRNLRRARGAVERADRPCRRAGADTVERGARAPSSDAQRCRIRARATGRGRRLRSRDPCDAPSVRQCGHALCQQPCRRSRHRRAGGDARRDSRDDRRRVPRAEDRAVGDSHGRAGRGDPRAPRSARDDTCGAASDARRRDAPAVLARLRRE